MIPRYLGLLRRRASSFSRNDLTIQTVQKPNKLPGRSELKGSFGKIFSDHILEINWTKEAGWDRPAIVPFEDFKISPAAMVFHYANCCFEGMKAFRDETGSVRLFRPDRNMSRLQSSMARLGFPEIDETELVELLKELLRVDERWVLPGDGYSLYIRPTVIATDPKIHVGPPSSLKLYIMTSPVGAYFSDGFKPVKLYADTENIRAWPGGVGNSKVGGNYAPGIQPQTAAAALGCSQVLWLFGEEHTITEAGSMNIMILIRSKDGNNTVLRTAPISRGDILPGVTRDSILALVDTWPDVEVVEEAVTMGEVLEAEAEGRLLEIFGTGTAANIAPVGAILYQGREIVVPTGSEGLIGPIGQRLSRILMDIQYGRTEHGDWSVVVTET